MAVAGDRWTPADRTGRWPPARSSVTTRPVTG